MLTTVIYCIFVGFWNLHTVRSSGGKDYKGKQFLFGFMDNFDNPSLEVFITTDSPGITDVNVSTPLYNDSILQAFSIEKGQVKMITLPTDIRGIDTELGNKGVQVLSTAEVAVFAVNKDSYTTDAYVVFPTDTLGRKYYVMSWPGRSAFMLVAIIDNTTIDITLVGAELVHNGFTYTSGTTLSIQLDKWQTFHAYSETGDFTGTCIISNNDITVLSGNKCIKIDEGYCDHTVSQMTPIETFGHNFVAISMPNCINPVSYKIISSEDNTNVNISGMPAVSLPTAGNFHTFKLEANSSKVVSANKPIALTFFAHGECDGSNLGDPAMILMPPVEQFAADYILATIEVPTNPFRNSLTIVIRDIFITGLLLDGKNMSSFTWRKVQGSDNLKVIDFEVNDGAHTVYHVDPTVTFLVVATGLANYNSYGFSAGQRLAPINGNCSESVSIPGDISDNDCDGFIDEEIQDGRDNDGDSRVDEDLAVFFGDITTASTTTQVISTEDATENTLTTTSNCTESVTMPGDIIDNDCDGFIDEEIQDGIDNDGDGRVDEDLAVSVVNVTTTSSTTQFTSTEDVPEPFHAILWIAGIIGFAAAVFCCFPVLFYILKKKIPQTRVHNQPKPLSKTLVHNQQKSPCKASVQNLPKPPSKTHVQKLSKPSYVDHSSHPDMSWNRF